MIYPNDLRTTLFSEIAEIIEEGGDCSPYDVVDFMLSTAKELLKANTQTKIKPLKKVAHYRWITHIHRL